MVGTTSESGQKSRPDLNRILGLTGGVLANVKCLTLIRGESDTASASAYPVSPETGLGDDLPRSERDAATSVIASTNLLAPSVIIVCKAKSSQIAGVVSHRERLHQYTVVTLEGKKFITTPSTNSVRWCPGSGRDVVSHTDWF